MKQWHGSSRHRLRPAWRRSYLTLTLSLLAATIAGCSRETPGTSSPSRTIHPVRVITTTTQSEFSYPVTFYGRIQTARRTSLAFEIPGQISSLLVDEGETIMAGTPVAHLNTSILAAERKRLVASKTVQQTILRRLEKGEREEVITAARAVVSRMEAELEQTSRDRDRLETLRRQNAVSASVYEAALFKAKSLQASLDASKASLLELESGTREEDIDEQKNRILELDAQVAVLDSRIEKAVLTAPFTAHVVQRMVDEGAVIQAAQPVLLLSEADRYEARFSIPITQLEETKAVKTIIAAGNNIKVRKARTISSVSVETRTVDVVFELNPAVQIIEGQNCTLIVSEVIQCRCVKLPLAALVPSVRGLWSCYYLEQEGNDELFRVACTDLTVNHTDGTWVYVETTLPDMTLVVAEGVHKLVPGMSVRIVEDQL